MRLEEYLQELEKVELLAPEEEKSLWQAFKERGERAARQRLIESYQPLVFKTALPWRTSESIMDIIQEGTVGLIAVHRIRGRMLNFLQKEGSRDVTCMDAPRADGKAPWELLPDTTPSVAEQAELGFMTRELHRALARLPQKERVVLESVYLKSETIPKIADVLDVSASHIYRLQKSGIRRVRGMLSRLMRF